MMKYPISCVTKKSATHSKVAPYWFTKSSAVEDVTSFTKDFDTFGVKDFIATGKLDTSAGVSGKIDRLNYKLSGDIEIANDDTLINLIGANIAHVLLGLHSDNVAENTIKKAITDHKGLVMFKAGASIKLIVSKLIEWSKPLKTRDGIRLANSITDIKNAMTPAESSRVVFSSHPWDILTMSMRGIESCMEWSSSHSRSLIGSVMCPYVGVIFTTNGKTSSYGPTMVQRSVVRLVKKAGSTNKPYLYVEPAYPKASDDAEDDDYDDEYEASVSATSMFREVLAKRIKGNRKLSGVVPTSDGRNYYMPITAAIRGILSEHRTYFDTGVRYGDSRGAVC